MYIVETENLLRISNTAKSFCLMFTFSVEYLKASCWTMLKLYICGLLFEV